MDIYKDPHLLAQLRALLQTTINQIKADADSDSDYEIEDEPDSDETDDDTVDEDLSFLNDNPLVFAG